VSAKSNVILVAWRHQSTQCFLHQMFTQSTGYVSQRVNYTDRHSTSTASTHRQTDRQTDRHTDRPISRQSITEIFAFEMYHDLETWVRGHSRSLEMALFNRLGMTSYLFSWFYSNAGTSWYHVWDTLWYSCKLSIATLHDACGSIVQCNLQCESKKNPPRGPDIFHFFTNGWEFLIDFLHTY